MRRSKPDYSDGRALKTGIDFGLALLKQGTDTLPFRATLGDSQFTVWHMKLGLAQSPMA